MIELILIGMLIFVFVVGISAALTLRVAVGWSTELIELRKYGREVTGRVVEKRHTRRRGNTSAWIRYEYVDQFGKARRSRRTIVTPDAWEAHSEGEAIAVVYSERRPTISAPKYLIDLDGTRT
jgi:hypothetical protein